MKLNNLAQIYWWLISYLYFLLLKWLTHVAQLYRWGVIYMEMIAALCMWPLMYMRNGGIRVISYCYWCQNVSFLMTDLHVDF